jgi:hypothetical protein
LSELDRIAAENPEYCQHQGHWDEKEVENIIMRTPTKDRMVTYRKRLKADGYLAINTYLTPGAKIELDRLREQHVLTTHEILSGLLTGQISHTQTTKEPHP